MKRKSKNCNRKVIHHNFHRKKNINFASFHCCKYIFTVSFLFVSCAAAAKSIGQNWSSENKLFAKLPYYLEIRNSFIIDFEIGATETALPSEQFPRKSRKLNYSKAMQSETNRF